MQRRPFGTAVRQYVLLVLIVALIWPQSQSSTVTAQVRPDPQAAPPVSKVFDLQKRRAEHWCWQPLRQSQPPDVKDRAWAKGPIDRFILSKLDAANLTPAPAADKRTLIRRAYFDLIGLPPSPQDVQAFLDDDSPQAFEKVVDQLLASDHFGERWARHWLDLVRYAQTYGHESDFPIEDAEPYVPYTVRALNADVPYNQFVREQIAGDLLLEPRTNPTERFNESIIGSGFWFFGEQTHSPVDVRQQQADRIDNQIEVFGKSLLGLTINCARCHDHKFDAIATNDYYALFGILESTRLQHACLDPRHKIDDAVSRIGAIRSEANQLLNSALPQPSSAGKLFSRYLMAAREAEACAANGDLECVASANEVNAKVLQRVVESLRDSAVRQPGHPLYAWSVLANADDGPTFIQERDALATSAKATENERSKVIRFDNFQSGSYAGWYPAGSAFGQSPTRAKTWDAHSGGVRFARAGLADSGAIDGRLRGVLRSKSFILQNKHIYYHLAGKGGLIRLVVDGYLMDPFTDLLFEGLRFKVDTPDGAFVWHDQNVQRYLGHRAHIELIDDGDGWVAVDDIRLTDCGPPPDSQALTAHLTQDQQVTSPQALADAYGELLARAISDSGAEQDEATEVYLMNWAAACGILFNADAEKKLAKELAERSKEIAQTPIPAPLRAVAAADGDGVDEHVFIRGNHNTLGHVVQRRFLEAIAGADQPPLPADSSGRLQLAQRVLDSSDPLISRVIVNRVWHHLLGRGIVPTTDDFGVMGQPPTHPELLDYLASQFIRDGWSIKRLIRSIMLTSAYQLSSVPSEAALKLDPDNKLLQHARVRRLEGEAIRDSILAISGRLDPNIDGPFVDVALTPFMEGRGKPPSGPIDGAGRRSVYLKVRRNFLSPMLLAFDMPIPFSTMGRRNVSNVPSQALILLNDPFVIEQCQLWAKNALADKGLSVSDRIALMYETAFARPPSEMELTEATQFLEQDASDLGLPSAARESDLRVWADLAHVLVNAKEFIFLN